MRIGLLASTAVMIDSFFLEIIDRWEADGHDVVIAAGDASDSRPTTVIPGLARRPGLGGLRARSELRRWVEELGVDIVVTNTATASGVVRLSGLRVPIVYFCHGLHWNTLSSVADRVWHTVEHALVPRTDAVITLNSDDHAWFRQRLPERSVLRVPAGVGLDLEDYPKEPMPHGILRLVWIGEHSSRKRPWLVLEFARELEACGLDFRITMVGGGELLEQTRSQIAEAELDAQIEALGWGDAVLGLRGAHALIHTSQWEGLPRVMLEAVAMGRQTYAFDVKGVRDIPAAVLVPEPDTAALAQAVAGGWCSGELPTGPQTDRSQLDYRRSADAILRFLQQIAADGGTRSGAP